MTKSMPLDHFNSASFTQCTLAHWFYWTGWKESTVSFWGKRLPPCILCSAFSLVQSVSIPNGSQFPSSLSSISQIQSLLHSQIMRCGCSSISAQCKPIYFSLSIADSIKQCPMSTQLSQREWFIAESQVFASLCEAAQCKISSFIFHIARAASLNILVSELWAEDSLKFKCGIKKPVPGFKECTNIIKYISSCWSTV